MVKNSSCKKWAFLVIVFLVGTQVSARGFDNMANSKKESEKSSDSGIVTKRAGNVVIVGTNAQGEADSLASGMVAMNELYGHLHKGRDLMQQKHYREAEAEFNLVIQGVGGKKDAWMGHLALMDLYEIEGDYEKAIKECEYAIQHSAEHAKPEYQKKLSELKTKAAQQTPN